MQYERATSAQRTTKTGYTPQQVRKSLWLILVAWGFGAPFFAITTGGIFTSFLKDYLHTSDLVYGIIMAAGPAAVFLQFLGSYLVERSGLVKRNFLILVTLHRLIWLAVAAVPLFYDRVPSAVAIWVVLGTVFLSQVSQNIGGAGWAAWMSRIVPRNLAGKYFGIRGFLGLITMVLANLAIAALLHILHSPGWMYTVAFGVAAIMGATDILLFIPVPEVPAPREETLPSLWELLRTPWRNEVFRGFALYSLITWIAYSMMGSFTWRYCLDPVQEHGLGMDILTATVVITIVPLLAMALVAPFWGQAIDRLGPRPIMAFSAACHFIIPLPWVFMRPELFWLLPIQAVLGGLAWPGIDQVQLYMQVKGFPDERRTAYNAAFAVVFGMAGTIGNFLGGVLASWSAMLIAHIGGLPAWVSHYQPVFLISLLMRFGAFVFILARLPLQGKGHHRDVARVIAGGMTDSIRRVTPGARRRRIPSGK